MANVAEIVINTAANAQDVLRLRDILASLDPTAVAAAGGVETALKQVQAIEARTAIQALRTDIKSVLATSVETAPAVTSSLASIKTEEPTAEVARLSAIIARLPEDAVAAAGGVDVAMARITTLEARANIKALDAAIAGLPATTVTAVAGTDEALANIKWLGANALVKDAGLVALAVAGIGVVAGKQAVDFQTMTTEIANNTTMSNADIGTMSNTIKQMSLDTGQSLDKLAAGFKYAFDYMGNTTDATKLLEEATKSAVSTGSDEIATVQILGKAMHDFHIPASDAATAMNQLHMAAQQSAVDLPQWVEAATPAIAQAATFGVSFTDLVSAMTAFTKQGYDVSSSATMMQAILKGIAEPTGVAKKAIEELSKASGIDLVSDFSAAGLASRGFGNIMADVEKATGGNTQQLLSLIPSIRGARGEILLLGNGYQDYTSAIAAQADILSGKANPTQDAYNRTIQTTSFHFSQLQAQFHLTMIELGTNLLPAITSTSEAFVKATQFVADHKAAQIALGGALGAVVTAFLAVKTAAFVIEAITIATKAWTAAQVLLNIAMDANPIGIIIVGIAALTAGIIYAYQHSDRFRYIVDQLGLSLKMMWDVLSLVATLIKEGIGRSVDWLADRFSAFGTLTDHIFGEGGVIGSAFDATGHKANDWFGQGGVIGQLFSDLGNEMRLLESVAKMIFGPGGTIGGFFDHTGTVAHDWFAQGGKIGQFFDNVTGIFVRAESLARGIFGAGGTIGRYFDDVGTKVHGIEKIIGDAFGPGGTIGKFFDNMGMKIHSLFQPLDDLIGKLGKIPGVSGIGNIIGGVTGRAPTASGSAVASSLAPTSSGPAVTFSAPGSAVSSSLTPAAATQTVIHVNVAGSVTTARGLAEDVRREFLRMQHQIGSLGFN